MKHPFFGETVNGEACSKLAKDMSEGSGFIKKNHIPFMVYDALYLGLCELWKTGRTETIIEQEAAIYRKYGFTVDPHGIGWQIA